jgi:DNA anti-recombination protein RmuC
MAARKSTTRKKTSRRKTTRKGTGLPGALGRVELPPTLRDYAKQVRKRLDRLERQITQAQTDVRRRAARLLREASHQLGRLEVRGEAGWRRLAGPYRKQLLDLLRRLEKAVSPSAARRKATRKRVRQVQKVVEQAAASIEPPLSS